MAARIDEPALSEVDLDEETRRFRARELEERYHHLPVHRLEKERELREVVLPPTPTVHRHVINGSEHGHSGGREYPVDVKHTQGHPATMTVTEQQVIHQQHAHPHQVEEIKTKQKRVGFGGFGFGRKGKDAHVGEGRDGEYHADLGYEKNGATSTHAYGQGRGVDYDKPTTLTVYPTYLKRPPGILRIIQLLVGIIVCAAVNAERCLSNSVTSIVCASASSPLWYGVLGGQGYVLFTAIIFILGNFALIFYHLCTRPKITTTAPATAKRSPFADKFVLAEVAYDVLALIMYIIAASVEAWYASWFTLPVPWLQLTGFPSTTPIRNVYRPQWIAATVFAWINVILYAISIVVIFLFRRR